MTTLNEKQTSSHLFADGTWNHKQQLSCKDSQHFHIMFSLSASENNPQGLTEKVGGPTAPARICSFSKTKGCRFCSFLII